MADSSANLTALLLQDAQQEIGSLRAELFNNRQVSEERRQLCESLTAEKSQLQQALSAAQSNLHNAEQQLQLLAQLQYQVKDLESRLSQSQQALSQNERKHAELQQAFNLEVSARAAAEDAKLQLQSEKSKLQKSRDELAAQVRLSQQKAREAEEEQLRAEDEAAGLRAELHHLQMNGNHEASSYVSNTYSSQPDLAPELEAERIRTATLYNTLTATKAELHRSSRQLDDARSELHSKDQQLQEAQRELQQMRNRLQQTEDELASCVARINDLQNQQRQQQQQHLLPSHSSQQSLQGTPQSSPSKNPRASTGSLSDASMFTPVTRHGSGRPSSSGSGAEVGDVEELTRRAEEGRMLAKKVASLKAARDKLLIQLDKQMMEADKLAIENKALVMQLSISQGQCTAWENQAQAALAQVEKLKDFIEESASWGDAAGTQQGQQPQHANGGPATPSEDVLKQVAKTTELDLQVRALCAEVGKARGGATAVGRSLLPLLQGVELKLAQLRAGGEAVTPVR